MILVKVEPSLAAGDRPAPPLRALRGLSAISLRHSDATDMGGRALRTGRMQPHSDTDRAPDVGVLAREHAVGITFRPESPPVGALDDRLAKDSYRTQSCLQPSNFPNVVSNVPSGLSDASITVSRMKQSAKSALDFSQVFRAASRMAGA